MHCPFFKGLGPVAIVLALAVTVAAAELRVQELTGHLSLDESILYHLAGLTKGRTLFVYAESTSGNLDPMVAILLPDVELDRLRKQILAELDEAIAAGQDPLAEFPRVLAKYVQAWDADSGAGDASALQFKIPADGDYRLLLHSEFATETFGEYRMLVGLDAPKVLTGEAAPTDAAIAELVDVGEPSAKSVSEKTGMLTPQNSPIFLELEPFRAGETLQLYVEATSGDLKPILFLADDSGQPIRSGNFAGAEPVAKLSYTFEAEARNYQVRLTSVPRKGEPTSGEYRLLAGLGAPEVLDGKAEVQGAAVLRQPIVVRVGLDLHQIASIDQKSERYDAVYDMIMKWEDSDLAYSPKSSKDYIRVYPQDEFVQYARENNIILPLFTLYNQQGRRWSQNPLTIITPDGQAIYFERFSATLQAPDFEFRKFPFDTQKFFARVDMLFPDRYFVFEDLEQFSRVGTALGEEEWVVSSFETVFEIRQPRGRSPHASFSFVFWAHRHLNYYVLRIILPVLAIICISWVTLFLKDYSKRVDLAGANLLVFIAFNFTIAGDLPRLGYLTIMDIILISTFLITSIMLVCCVCLRRLETIGREALARRIDRYLLWAYPIAYVLVVGMIVAILLR